MQFFTKIISMSCSGFPQKKNKKKTQFRAMLYCYRRNSQFFYIIYLEIGMDFEPQIVVTGQKYSLVWTQRIFYSFQNLSSNMLCCNCKTSLFCQNFRKSRSSPIKTRHSKTGKKRCMCVWKKGHAITKAPCTCVKTVKSSSLGLINEELVKWCSLAGYTIAQEDALKTGFVFCY